jgi:tetratricopeptide (TPR) repeat protein
MVSAETGAVSIVKADAETGVATTANPGDDMKLKTAAEQKWKQADNMISIARELLAKPQVADVATYADAEARVKIAVGLLEQGKAYFEAGAYGKAFITFQEAFSIAQKAVIVLKGGNQFGISIGATIEVPQPTIVPSEGQSEGQKTEGTVAKARYGEAARAIQEIRSFISVRMAVMTEEVAKKVEASLAVAETRFAEGKKYYEVGAYAKASESFELSMRAVKDVYALIYGEDPRVPPTDPSLFPGSGATTPSAGVQVDTKVNVDGTR